MKTDTPNFEFGKFLLDTQERVLLRDGKPLSITPKAFQLLLVLVENQGHIVEKAQLMKLVWADSFVEEGNITFTVGLLRKLLEEDAKDPRFIETVARRGYRFIAEVRIVERGKRVESDGLTPPETAQPRISLHSNFAVERVGNVLAVTEWQDTAEKDINSEKEIKYLLRFSPPVAKARSGKLFWLAVVVSAVVLAGNGIAWYYFVDLPLNSDAKKISSMTTHGNPSFRVMNFDSGRIFNFAYSPDGRARDV